MWGRRREPSGGGGHSSTPPAARPSRRDVSSPPPSPSPSAASSSASAPWGPRAPAVRSEVVLKIAVVGGRGSGKSAVVRRYVGNHFNQALPPTEGLEQHLSPLPHYRLGNASMCLSWWDVAGDALAAPAVALAMRRLSAVVLCVDPFDARSVEDLDAWRAVVARHAPQRGLPLVLLATKSDLEGGARERLVSDEALDRYCRAAGVREWRAVTATAGRSVHEALNRLVEIVIKSELARWRAGAPPDDRDDASPEERAAEVRAAAAAPPADETRRRGLLRGSVEDLLLPDAAPG